MEVASFCVTLVATYWTVLFPNPEVLKPDRVYQSSPHLNHEPLGSGSGETICNVPVRVVIVSHGRVTHCRIWFSPFHCCPTFRCH